MANERDDEQFGKQDPKQEFGQDKQPPTGQQNQPSALGQNQQPPTGQQGQSSSGQTDLGTGDDTDTLNTELGFGNQISGGTGGTPGSQSPGGTGGAQGGFVGSQGTGSIDYLQENSSAKSDFAAQGQGALEGEDEDVETGQRRKPNDIEGGTGA